MLPNPNNFKKIILITGATSGIGKEAAKSLAILNYHLVLVGRNEEKTKLVAQEIKNLSNNPQIDYLIADLSLLNEVKKLANNFSTKYTHLDVLINNAGGVNQKKTITSEGLELTFALNHLSYFYLTDLLLDSLKNSQSARIVNVSSAAHKTGQVDFANLQGEKSYSSFISYAKSKLENILFTNKLSRFLVGTKITVNALHPGRVNTNFGKQSKAGLIWKILSLFFSFGAITPAEGSKTIAYLASSDEVEGVSGKYFYKNQAIETSEQAKDIQAKDKLWQISLDIIKKVVG